MSRQLYRVPLDFDFPIGETWAGFINDRYRACPDCGGTGSAPHGHYLEHVAQVIALGGSYPDGHPFMTSPYRGPIKSGPEWGKLSGALAGRGPDHPFGHDGLDRYAIGQAILKAAGLPEKWGWCGTCDGDGLDPAAKAHHDAWEPTPVPEGDGYQIWQTVSEGGPVSPVFAEPEDLADWMVNNDDSVTRGTTREQWLAFIRGPGWAPSMVSVGAELVSGVEFVAGGAE